MTEVQDAPAAVPVVSYLELGEQPRLVARVCDHCGAQYFDRRVACARCGRTAFSQQPLATTGTLRTFTITHRAAPGVPTPFATGVVDLDGGGTVKANLVEVALDPETITLGMRVELTTFVAGTDEAGTQAVAFGFRPIAEERS